MARRHTPQTRARDSDRAHTCARLDAAYADGQLTGEEHRDLLARARSAKTLRELAELVSDLQPDATPGPAEPAPGARRLRITVACVSLVAVAAIVWLVLPSRDTPPTAPPTTPTTAPEPAAAGTDTPAAIDPIVVEPVYPLRPGGIGAVIDAYRSTFGDTLVQRLGLYDDHAFAERALPDAPDRIADYSFRGGFQRSSESTSSRMPGHSDVDLAVLDVAAIEDLVQRAPALADHPDGTVSHVLIDNDGTVTVAVYVTEGGYVRATADGTVLRVYG